MKIRVWRGFHSEELLELVRGAWERDELLVLCPPALKDFGFVDLLPEGEVRGAGELVGEVFHRKSGVAPIDYPGRPVLGVFTSGTLSGTPRLVLYSKRNLEFSLSGIRSFFNPSRFDTIFCYPQPFHTFGLVLGYVHAAVHGLKLVTGQGKYTRAFHQRRAELREESLLTLGTPTHFHDLLAYARGERTQLMPSYSCILGGAKVSRLRRKRGEPRAHSPAARASPWRDG